VQTTLPFHRWLLTEAEFVTTAGLSTDLVDRLWQPAPIVARAALRAAELAAAAGHVVGVAPARPAAAGPTAAGPTTDAQRWWQAGIAEATENRP
jgi:hypothetical protein